MPTAFSGIPQGLEFRPGALLSTGRYLNGVALMSQWNMFSSSLTDSPSPSGNPETRPLETVTFPFSVSVPDVGVFSLPDGLSARLLNTTNRTPPGVFGEFFDAVKRVGADIERFRPDVVLVTYRGAAPTQWILEDLSSRTTNSITPTPFIPLPVGRFFMTNTSQSIPANVLRMVAPGGRHLTEDLLCGWLSRCQVLVGTNDLNPNIQRIAVVDEATNNDRHIELMRTLMTILCRGEVPPTIGFFGTARPGRLSQDASGGDLKVIGDDSYGQIQNFDITGRPTRGVSCVQFHQAVCPFSDDLLYPDMSSCISRDIPQIVENFKIFKSRQSLALLKGLLQAWQESRLTDDGLLEVTGSLRRKWITRPVRQPNSYVPRAERRLTH